MGTETPINNPQKKLAPQPQRTTIAAGETLSGYEVIERLSGGGMASLFLGRRIGVRGFARPVAIKVVHPRLCDRPDFINMFIDEARISARIAHPNVVHVEELGQENDLYYLVMEYVDGCSLSEIHRALARKNLNLTPAAAVYIISAVAAGLHAAHTTLGDDGAPLGIVHRDVSPQNVLLSFQGHVKLIDFGVAKARGRINETGTHAFKGKVRYSSPEQAWGQPVDSRSDIFSLGVVLWELLTGRRLFRGKDDLAIIQKVRAMEIPPPHAINPAVSPELSGAVMRALTGAMDARPSTAAEWRRELLSAEPEARLVDSGVVALLMRNLMKEQIEERRERFGSSSGVVANTEACPSRETTAENELKVERAYAHLTVWRDEETEDTASLSEGAEITIHFPAPPSRTVLVALAVLSVLTAIAVAMFFVTPPPAPVDAKETATTFGTPIAALAPPVAEDSTGDMDGAAGIPSLGQPAETNEREPVVARNRPTARSRSKRQTMRLALPGPATATAVAPASPGVIVDDFDL